MHRRFALLRLLFLSLVLAPSWASSPVFAAVEIGVDHNRDGVIRIAGDGKNPRIPVDTSSREEAFIFWINDDQDDLDYYESWPLDRPDYETDKIDSLRDLEDFTRFVVRVDFEKSDQPPGRLRLELDALSGSPTINLYSTGQDDCNESYIRDRDIGEKLLERSRDEAPLQLFAGRPVEIALAEAGERVTTTDYSCFVFEGRAEGLGAVRASLLHGDAVIETSAPAWLAIRHVKRLYQRVTVPWPPKRKDVFEYDESPPPLKLFWSDDPQGYPFEPAWYETDDVIVWVYGWLKSAPGLYEMSTVQSGETIFKRLWHRGYRGRLVFFHWPTVKQKIALGLGRSEYRGYKTGPVLMDFVHSFPPDKRVHVTAHSLGGVPLMSALAHGMKAEHALFQASAVPAEAFDTNPDLFLPDMKDVVTPVDPAHGGYHGLLSATRTRIYNLYNTTDVTWVGWNLVQKDVKMSAPWLKHYGYEPTAPEGQQYYLKRGPLKVRPVDDPDEVRAMITRARTNAIGAEPRVRGVVYESYDLNRPPFDFGHGHVVAWSWNPQETTSFYNLVLDLFNIRYNSEHH